MGAITFGFPISKFDVERRVVCGTATSAIKDRQGDIIPYHVAMSAFERAASTMGVREMHERKAVGRLDAYQGVPDSGCVDVEVYISKSRDGEDALTKVGERVLKGFSIGGRASASHYDSILGANVIDALEISEISLVDVPANPDAMISVVKLDDVEKADAPTKSVDGEEHPASDFAYDSETPDVIAKTAAPGRPVLKALSYNDLYSKLGEAVRATCEMEGASSSDVEWDCYVVDFGVDWVVYQFCGKTYRRGWGRAGADIFVGSTVQEVEATYTTADCLSSVAPSELAGDGPGGGQAPQEDDVVVIGKGARQQEAAMNEFQIGLEVTKALMARGVVMEKSDVAATLTAVKSLLAGASENPDALAQAQAALDVVADMVGALPTAGSTSPSASTSTSTVAACVTKADDAAPEPAAEAVAQPAEQPVPEEVEKAASVPSGPSAPAGFAGAPEPGHSALGTQLEEAARAGAQAVVDQLLGAGNTAPPNVSKAIGVTPPQPETGDAGVEVVKAVEAGDFAKAAELAGDTMAAEETVMKHVRSQMDSGIRGYLGGRR